MIGRYLYVFGMSLIAVAMAVPAALISMVAPIAHRVADYVASLLPEPFQFRAPLPAADLYLGNSTAAVAPSLFHFNRHEASVSRRAAQRHV